MAMYEKEGSCPSNAFLRYRIDGKAAVEHEKIVELLGDRIGYMVYDQKDHAWGRYYPSVVEALLGGNGSLGFRVARYLRNIIPVCRYAEIGKKIVIHDVLSPSQIAGDILYFRDESFERWAFFGKDGKAHPDDPITIKDGRAIFSDERFLVVVVDKEDIVEMWILATPSEAENDAT